MKAFLIDPTNKSVTEVAVEAEHLDTYYKLIGCRLVQAAYFTTDSSDIVFVDEEGLLRGDNFVEGFFTLPGMYNPCYGKGIVVGGNPETGDTIAPLTTLEWLQANVKFESLDEVQAHLDTENSFMLDM